MSSRVVVFATPFRVFFLAAAVSAVVLVPAWLLALGGAVRLKPSLPLMWWHAHEMIFGFVSAVLAGFLLTAARNWTQRDTLGSKATVALFLLWIAGRVGAAHGADCSPWLVAGIDGAFFALVAAGLGRAIHSAASKRNYAFPVLIATMGAADVAVHLAAAGTLSWAMGARAMMVGLDVVALIVFLFAGRIIPMFTANATGGVARARSAFDLFALAAMAAFAITRMLAPASAIAAALAISAGLLNAARLYGWGGLATVRKPILWVLHLGWLFTALGIVATGLAHFVEGIRPSAALHLETVGGLAVLIIGMMARVSLGHTGRKLVVPNLVAIAFAVLLLSGLVRVIAPFLSAEYYLDALWAAAIGWAAAFAAFAIGYARILLGPRADGKPG